MEFFDDSGFEVMNSEWYINLLDRHLRHIPNIKRRLFQHDNAPSHSADDTVNYLDYHRYNVVDWPARSPDLNLIENVFGAIK